MVFEVLLLLCAAVLEVFLYLSTGYIIASPTIAYWIVGSLFDEWGTGLGLLLGILVAGLSVALYTQPMSLLLLIPLYSLVFDSLHMSWTIHESARVVGVALLIGVWALAAAWTLFALCGTLVCAGAFVLMHARRYRQSRCV